MTRVKGSPNSPQVIEVLTGGSEEDLDFTGRISTQIKKTLFRSAFVEGIHNQEYFVTGGGTKALVIGEAERKRRVNDSIRMYSEDVYYRNIIENIVSLILGGGITISPEGKKQQNRWERFEKRNNFQYKMQQALRSALLTGECFIRFFRKGSNVDIRFIDPMRVTKLVTSDSDIEDLRSIEIQTSNGTKTISGKELIYIKYDPFGVNERGVPFVSHGVVKKLERLDMLEYTRLLLNLIRASIPLVWKVPGTPKQVKDAGNAQTQIPGAGSMITIGSEEEIYFPDLNVNSTDTKEDSVSLLRGAAAAAGLTVDFISGQGVNFSNTRLLDAGSPVVRGMEIMQNFFLVYVEKIIDEVLGNSVNRRVVAPRIAQRNLQSDAQGLLELFKAGGINRQHLAEYMGYDYFDVLEGLESELNMMAEKNILQTPGGLQLEDELIKVTEIMNGAEAQNGDDSNDRIQTRPPGTTGSGDTE